jgi:hypothetical protein
MSNMQVSRIIENGLRNQRFEKSNGLGENKIWIWFAKNKVTKEENKWNNGNLLSDFEKIMLK